MNQFAPGTHNDVRISDIGFGESSTGSSHIWVVFEKDDASIIGFFYLTDKAIVHTQKALLRLGARGDWDEIVAGIESGELLVGTDVQVIVEMDEFEGKTRPKVKWVNENNFVGGMQRSENAGAKAKKFAALWTKIVPEDDVPF